MRLDDYIFNTLDQDRYEFSSREELRALVLRWRVGWPNISDKPPDSRPKPRSDRFVSLGSLFKAGKAHWNN